MEQLTYSAHTHSILANTDIKGIDTELRYCYIVALACVSAETGRVGATSARGVNGRRRVVRYAELAYPTVVLDSGLLDENQVRCSTIHG